MTDIKRRKVFIINGVASSGKDTFVEMLMEIYDKEIINVRSSDEIKRIAKILGWDGKKDDKGRKFLAELMGLVRGYNDGIFNYWKKFINKNSNFENVIFLHVRENIEIFKYVCEFGCKTILVERGLTDIPNNSSDQGVYNYRYDIIIKNDSNLKSLMQKAIEFINIELK